MTIFSYTPISVGAAADAATFNAVYDEFAAGLGDVTSLSTDSHVLADALNEVHALMSSVVDSEAFLRAAADNALDERIDNLIVTDGGDPGPEVADARLAIRHGADTGDAPSVLAETIEWGAANLYNVLAYGAAPGNTAVDNDAAISEAIADANSNGGGIVFVPAGTYLVDSITLKSKVTLLGEGRLRTILQKTSVSPTGAIGMLDMDITGSDIEDVRIARLKVVSTEDVTTRAVWLNTDGFTIDVVIDECEFLMTGSDNAPVIQLGQANPQGARLHRVLIRNCFLQNHATPDANAYGIYVAFDDMVNNNDSSIRVENCQIVNGREGFTTNGTGTGPNVWFVNNFVKGQSTKGATFYHSQNVRCVNNTFSEITSPAEGGDDSGVIYLDTHSPTTNFRGGLCAFNVVRDCNGNGIYAEDFVGGTIGFNHVINCDEHTTYTAASGNSSDGGHGIVIAAGCHGTTVIGNRIQLCEGSGIFVARDMAPDDTENISSLRIIGNYIVACDLHGIHIDCEFDSQSGDHIIAYNTLNGTSAANTAGVYVQTSGTTTPTLGGTLSIVGNQFATNPRGYYHDGINFGRIIVNDNRFNHSGGVAVNNSGAVGGVFSANLVQAGSVTLADAVLQLGNFGYARAVPSTATSTGALGQMVSDASNAYFAHAANTWRRVAISSW